MNNKLKQSLDKIKMPPDSKERVRYGAKNAVRSAPKRQTRLYAVAFAVIALTVAVSMLLVLLTDSGVSQPEASSDDRFIHDASSADTSSVADDHSSDTSSGTRDDTVSQMPVSDYVLSEQKMQMVSAFYGELAKNNPEIHQNFFRLYDTFSIELFLKCAGTGEKNVMLSPLSVLTALSMVMNGADGDTKAAVEKQIGMTAAELGRSITAYARSLYQSEDCTVTSVCSMWIRDEYKGNIRDSFCDALEDIYDSEIMLAPFDSATVDSINAWCSKNTSGRLKKLISDIPDDTVLLLANALVFEAEWQELQKAPVKRKFNGLGGTKEVDMLLDTDDYCVLYDEDCTGFLKDYKGGRYAFAALLPNDENENIYSFAASLATGRWRYLFDTAFEASAHISLPCFSADYSDTDLQEKLNEIGYSALTDLNADFMGILKSPFDGSFRLGNVTHSVHLDVTPFGTVAAGATVAAMPGDSFPQYRIDLTRPFVYAIVDKTTGSMLFVGVITDIG